MNYVLSIDLEGASGVDSKLDAITKKFSQFKIATNSITSLKIGVGDIARAFEKASNESSKFEKNLSKMLAVSNKMFPAAFGEFGSGKQPNVSLPPASSASVQSAWQTALKTIGKQNLASGGQPMPKTADELFEEKELKIKKMATEARRKDLMEADAKKAVNDRARFFKDMTFLMMPIFNPGSVWATLFSSRQTFSALMTNEGQNRLSRFGLSGIKGASIGAGFLVGASTAVGLALMALSSTVKLVASEIRQAFAFAHQLYGKSLSSGLSVPFVARQQMTASVLGVPETEIYRFKQSGYVMNRLADAVGRIAKAAPDLAYTEAQFKILKYDALAAGSEIADKLSPALNGLATVLDVLIKAFEKLSDTKFGKLIESLAKLEAGVGGGHSWLDFLAMIGNQAKNAGGGTGFGSPQSYMKQLPVSSWEKMGLVVAGGAATTNDLIRKSNGYLKTIADSVRPGNGVPRGFGMDPSTANP